MTTATRDRLRGCLFGLAVGDALGAAVEFKAPGTFTPVTGFRAGGPHRLGPGEWTDDTSLAVALGDSIVSVGWDLNDQARRYLDWFENGRYSVTGKCFDIGNQTRAALAQFKRTGDALSSGSSAERSSGNGSIMRLAPVPVALAGLYPDQVKLLADFAEQSSVPTHPSALCRSACRYLGVVLAALAAGEPREEVLSATWPVLDVLGPLHPTVDAVARGSFRAKQPPAIRGGGYVVDSLEAALWAFAGAQDFREAVLRAVNLGDDADTTGAVCGQLAGACWGESGIPAEWRTGLARTDLLEAALGGTLRSGAMPAAALPSLPSARVDRHQEEPSPTPIPPESLPAGSYWVVTGRLLAGCFPGSLDPVEQERKYGAFADLGITTFISLMEVRERNHSGGLFPDYGPRIAELARERGNAVLCERYPIRDNDVPSAAEMVRILDAIDRGLADGRVYVHCWGGVGRTGTVVGCWLLRHGHATRKNVLEMIAKLRQGEPERRDRTSPETEPQRDFVRGWGHR